MYLSYAKKNKNMNDTFKGIIIGVISSLIASGIIYAITESFVWNFTLPLWIWLCISLSIFLLTYTIRKVVICCKVKNFISEFTEGSFGNSYVYTWKYKRCRKGEYSAYGYEATDIHTKKPLAEMNNDRTITLGHEIPEETIKMIRTELQQRLGELYAQNKLVEAQRLEQRVKYDIEMIKEMGYCSGIENYSRILERRPVGSPPATLLDYFKDDFLLVIDESHVTIPQLKGMYRGDAARKDTLIEYGFRLPCAKDNRPLTEDEFWSRVHQKIFISATPAVFERSLSEQMVEQIIRPTGLVDPEITVKPTVNQVDDLIDEIKKVTDKNERVLITTLTKRMAEDLTEYLNQIGVKVRYLHSEIQSLERVEILRDLRLGNFDVLVGVNLLREGLDIPEVSLVAIMDADKEGFLRSETSLIQTIGRAARNACGRVIMYADKITESMDNAISETNRRRDIQMKYNEEHGIVPKTIKKPVENNLLQLVASYRNFEDIVAEEMVEMNASVSDIPKIIEKLEKDMHKAAKILDFERAAEIRDQLKKLREMAKIKKK